MKVIGSVSWDGHDNACAIVGFHEDSREDRDLVARDRIPDSLPQQLACLSLTFYGDFVILVLKLLHRLPTDDPGLSVNSSSEIGGFRVDP